MRQVWGGWTWRTGGKWGQPGVWGEDGVPGVRGRLGGGGGEPGLEEGCTGGLPHGVWGVCPGLGCKGGGGRF